jgi:hypothetical protein
MNQPDDKYVYHGSKEPFETAIPKRQIRSCVDEEGNVKTIFDDISFHATPYKWIGLAYTYDRKRYEINGKIAQYNIGISLYEHTEEIEIFGFNSMEESLEKLYGDGGYLFVFEKDRFFHAEGLGDLEVISKDPLRPIRVDRIDDPVATLKKLGIRFKYIDLALPQNEKWRNYR